MRCMDDTVSFGMVKYFCLFDHKVTGFVITNPAIITVWKKVKMGPLEEILA